MFSLRPTNSEPRTPNPELRTPNSEPRTPNPELRTPVPSCTKRSLEHPYDANTSSSLPSGSGSGCPQEV